MKIASQRLPLSPAPNPSALRDLSGENAPPLESQTYKSLFPPARHHRFLFSLFSVSYKSLGEQLPCFHIYTKPRGGVSLCAPALRTLCCLCCPRCFVELVCSQELASSCFLFRSFPCSCRLFSMIYSLFCQNTGGGSPWDSESWPSSVDLPSIQTLPRCGGAMISNLTPRCKAPLAASRIRLRTSNLNGPKWSIIPAPASAARLRGRSV